MGGRAGEWPPLSRIQASTKSDPGPAVPKRKYPNSMLRHAATESATTSTTPSFRSGEQEVLKEIRWTPANTYENDPEMRKYCCNLVNEHWNNPNRGLKESGVLTAVISGPIHNAPESGDPLGEHLSVRFCDQGGMFITKRHVYPWELTSTRDSQSRARKTRKFSDLVERLELDGSGTADVGQTLDQSRRKTT